MLSMLANMDSDSYISNNLYKYSLINVANLDVIYHYYDLSDVETHNKAVE